jgi:hypothetical protein
METFWICTAHVTDPTVHCGARGEGDSGAARHTERAPKHSTLTTTRRELADRLAGPTDKDAA